MDKPFFQRYLIWVVNILQGDFGTSYSLNRPVIDEVIERFQATLILSGTAFVLCSLFGIIIGTISANKVVTDLESACKKNTPEIRIATPSFKPSKNKTDRIPDYYIHETDEWLVFPHELQGLSMDEIKSNKPELDSLIKNIEALKSK